MNASPFAGKPAEASMPDDVDSFSDRNTETVNQVPISPAVVEMKLRAAGNVYISEARKRPGRRPKSIQKAEEIADLTKKGRKKTNKAPAGGAGLAMAAATQFWLTDEEWEAILESLPEIEVDVAVAGETVALGFRKLKNSRLSH